MLAAILKVIIIKCLTITVVVTMRGPHHPRGHHYHHSPKPNQKLTQDTQLLQDVEHIKEDLGNILTNEQAHQMTPEELEFHYFKLHDFDNNTKLDGLEILQAIHHSTHGSEDDNDYESGGGGGNGDHNRRKTTSLKMGTTDNEGNKEVVGRTTSNGDEDFHYFVDLIDQVLAEDDLDNDGYLNYIEYVLGRQKDQNKRNSNADIHMNQKQRTNNRR